MKRFLHIVVPLGLAAFVIYGATVLHVINGLNGDGDAVPAECAIVFGTAVHAVRNEQGEVISAVAGPGIRRRVQTAARLYGEGSVQKIFLTGGLGEGSLLSEAEVMRREALKNGIAARDITLEDQSRSTWENIRNVAPLTTDCDGIVAISDRYHLARIQLLARSFDLDVKTLPADREPGKAFLIKNLLREALGILFYLPLLYS